MKKDIFISHASEDNQTIVEPLVNILEANSISCWYDKKDIGWGDSIVGKINEGLESSKYVIFIISRTFLAKNWTTIELNITLNMQISSGEKKVLPIIVGDIQPHELPPLLRDKKYIQWSHQEEIVDELKKILGRETDNQTPINKNFPIYLEQNNKLEITNALSTFFQFIPYTHLLIYINDFPEYFSIKLLDVEDMWNRFKISNPHQYPFQDTNLNILLENFFDNQRDIEEIIQSYFNRDNLRINCFDSIVDYNGTNHNMKMNYELNEEERKILYEQVNKLKPLYISNYSELISYIRQNYPNVKLNGYKI